MTGKRIALIPLGLKIGDKIGIITPCWPDFSNSILFIEVPSFSPDVLHNRLHQFKQAGLFDQIQRILIGFAKEAENHKVENIYLEVTSEYDFPLVKTNNFGHNCPNTGLSVGVKASLDADTSTLALLEPCVE